MTGRPTDHSQAGVVSRSARVAGGKTTDCRPATSGLASTFYPMGKTSWVKLGKTILPTWGKTG